MTPEQIEQHRKRFEELYLPRFGFINCFDTYIGGGYTYSEVQTAFDCYLMFAENIEVELPAILAPGGEITESDVLCRMAHNDLLFEIKFTLESQGIKVKP